MAGLRKNTVKHRGAAPQPVCQYGRTYVRTDIPAGTVTTETCIVHGSKCYHEAWWTSDKPDVSKRTINPDGISSSHVITVDGPPVMLYKGHLMLLDEVDFAPPTR
jgi:hypothetical protein